MGRRERLPHIYGSLVAWRASSCQPPGDFIQTMISCRCAVSPAKCVRSSVFDDCGVAENVDFDVAHLDRFVNAVGSGLGGDGHGLGLRHPVRVRVSEAVVIDPAQRGRVAFQRRLLPGIHRGEDVFFGVPRGEHRHDQEQHRKRGFHGRRHGSLTACRATSCQPCPVFSQTISTSSLVGAPVLVMSILPFTIAVLP